VGRIRSCAVFSRGEAEARLGTRDRRKRCHGGPQRVSPKITGPGTPPHSPVAGFSFGRRVGSAAWEHLGTRRPLYALAGMGRPTRAAKMSEGVLHCEVEQRHMRRSQPIRDAALKDACSELLQGHAVNRIVGPNERSPGSLFAAGTWSAPASCVVLFFLHGSHPVQTHAHRFRGK
jgi:hypothetical protein